MTARRSSWLLALGLALLALPATAGEVILLAPLELTAAQPVAPAVYLKTPLPPYPRAAREQRLEGVVLLSVLVGTSGRVVDVHVASSSGTSLLDEAAASVVRQWTFVPARRGSRAVESVVEVPVKFQLTRE